MKKIVLVLAVLCVFYVPNIAFGDSPKTDEELGTFIIAEKLGRIESSFAQIIDQERFREAAYYSYAQLLRAIAESPIGSKSFFHEENDFGVFNIIVATELREGELFYVARIIYEKHVAAPLYNATLLWNIWSNESDNKEFVLVVFEEESKDRSVSRLIRFPIEDNLLGNPVFVFTENLSGMHQMIGHAEDINQDGIIDYIRIYETYLNVEKITTAKKLGKAPQWNDVEVCENGVCRKMKLG